MDMATNCRESALDVLSRAASLIGDNEREDRLKALRHSPAKDLPTRTSKQKRLKDRRELDYMSMKARHRRSAETRPTSPPPMGNGGSKMNAASESDSEEGKDGDNCEKEEEEDDLDIDEEEEDDGDGEHQHVEVLLTVDEDSPLDMTTPNRSRAASPPSSPSSLHVPTTRIYNPAPSYNGCHLQAHSQQRPSVITCAAALNHHHPHHRHQGHHQHGHMVSLLRGTAANPNTATKGGDARAGTRREIPSGMCDPVIDEHFRRSLGKDYPEFLSSGAQPRNANPPTNSSISITGMSVDDHFAKALGDTWLRLQAGKQPEVVLPTPAANSTAKSISTTSSSTLGLQQRPGVVST